MGELKALTSHIPGLPVLQSFGEGFVHAMAEMVTDMANPFIHPIDTGVALKDFIEHPINHTRAIIQGLKATCSNNSADCAGKIAFAIFTGGVSLVAEDIGSNAEAGNATAGNALQRFAEGFTGGASAFIQGTSF